MPRSFPDMLRDQLEPSVAETMGHDVWGLPEIDRAVAISQAISLRRIADLLEVARVDGDSETVLTLPQILLRSTKTLEEIPSSVYHAISNALIEDLHRRS